MLHITLYIINLLVQSAAKYQIKIASLLYLCNSSVTNMFPCVK